MTHLKAFYTAQDRQIVAVILKFVPPDCKSEYDIYCFLKGIVGTFFQMHQKCYKLDWISVINNIIYESEDVKDFYPTLPHWSRIKPSCSESPKIKIVIS